MTFRAEEDHSSLVFIIIRCLSEFYTHHSQRCSIITTLLIHLIFLFLNLLRTVYYLQLYTIDEDNNKDNSNNGDVHRISIVTTLIVDRGVRKGFTKHNY